MDNEASGSCNAPDFTFYFSETQRKAFQSGALRDLWHLRYPMLIDEDDLQLAITQPENHFYEWLSAILLYEATGMLSLIAYYAASTHKRKNRIFRAKTKDNADALIRAEKEGGFPDLFVYRPNTDDWFFCEVKGYRDVVRENQKARFDWLLENTGRQVKLMQLNPIERLF